MRRAIVIAAFILLATALVAPVSAHEAPAGPNVSIGIEGWNGISAGNQEQFIDRLRGALGEGARIPLPTDDLWTFELAIGDFWFAAATQPITAPDTPLGNDRHVCAYYDAERATYTGTVAVLERADDIATAADSTTAVPVRATYRLLVLTTHEDTAQVTSDAAGEPTLNDALALALLANAEAAQRVGLATRKEYTGHAVREGNRLRFTSVDGSGLPKTMVVFTTAGLAIIESTAGQLMTRGDGPYRCAQPQPPGNRPLLPIHCAEARSGNVDLASFPAPQVEVRLIQAALDNARMAPGPIDGILGPRTLGALIRWNASIGAREGRIVVYEVICPLIETHGLERAR